MYEPEVRLYDLSKLNTGDQLIFVSKFWGLRHIVLMISPLSGVHNRSNHNWNFKDDGIVVADLATLIKNHAPRSRELRIKKYVGSQEFMQKAIEKALASVGDMNYNLIFNNCQHFVNTVLYDVKRSEQIQQFSFNLLKGA